MNWPKPSDFDAPKFSDRKNDTGFTSESLEAERERREWIAFEDRLKRFSKETRQALRSILAATESEEFAAWIEGMTGRESVDAAAGFRRMVIAAPDFMETKAQILESMIYVWESRRLADRGYLRSLWADELVGASSRERRRLLMRLATPPWADASEILEAYRIRDEMTESTGIQHHVDHIVPIQHPFVCGLNCAANLRVIPAKENLKKHNKFTVGGSLD